MAKGSPLINQFNGGELSPRVDARSDLAKYHGGCRVLENMMPFVEGGATRVPGTYFVAEVKDSTKKVRLVGFHFSTVQAYVLEFGDLYIRFYKDQGQIVVAYAAWTAGGGHSYVLGDLVTYGGSYYRCIVAHSSDTSFAVDLAAAKWEETSGASDLAYEIPSTYTEAELFELKFVQSADYLYIVHPDHAPATLTRSAHTTWTLAALSLTADPFGASNYPGAVGFFEQRLWFAGTDTNPQTIWASVSGDYDNFTVTAAEDDSSFSYAIASDRVDRIRWLMGTDVMLVGTVGGIWRVSSTNESEPISPTNVSVKKQSGLGVKDLEPEAVGADVLFVSRAGTSVRQMVYDYATDKWISVDMTRIAKHITYGDDEDGTGIGDVDFQTEPVPIFWGVRADGELLGMTYETQEEVFAWFRVVTNGEFESVAVISAEDAEDEVWVSVLRVVGGSEVRFVEYFKPLNFYSQLEDCFFVHSGLTYDGGEAVEITGITQANPAVVSAVNSFTDGDKVRITEVEGMTQVNQGLTKAYTVANRAAGSFELSGIDSSGWGAYTSGGSVQKVTNSPSGLDHLEGEAVSVLIDGAVHSTEPVVTGGEIQLAWYGNKIHAGLGYSSVLEPMKIHLGTEGGTSRGKKQRITRLTVSFYETVGAKAGPDEDNLKSIPFGTGVQPSLFTGDKDFEMDGDWGNEATICLVQDQPLPMTVLALIPRVTIDEA